jgi:hypothetical protein
MSNHLVGLWRCGARQIAAFLSVVLSLAGPAAQAAAGPAAAQGAVLSPVLYPVSASPGPAKASLLAAMGNEAKGLETRTMTLREMGAYRPIELRGTDRHAYVPLTVRFDESVVRARLHLVFTFSPSLIPELSQLRILVDDQALSTVRLPRERLGTPQEVDVDLDPRYFVDFARLHFEFIGHYTLDCEFPFHSTLWANISSDSSIELVTRPLVQANDLSVFPAPFFDRRDGRRLTLPFAFAATPSLATLQDAGMLASWFGAQAAYRGAQFTVARDRLPLAHTVVLATNAERPAGLHLPLVEQATIAVVNHPDNPHFKVLLLLGKDDAQLRSAVQALVLGQAILSGDKVEVRDVTLPDPLPAYRAPAVVPTGERVRLGDLVDQALQLQAQGETLDPISVNLRLPADTFTWEARGMPVDLRFRYTPPRDFGQANLLVRINDEFVQSFPLRPASSANPGNERLELPFLEDNGALVNQSLTVPAFQLGSNNQLQFLFDIPPQDAGRCRATLGNIEAAIDPDSTLDLTHIEHYAPMPNLAYFANSGFPFTKFADLSQTAVVLPDHPSMDVVEAYLTAFGVLGASTGMSGTRFTVVDQSHVKQAADRDLLVIDAGGHSALLDGWKANLPAVFDASNRASTGLGRLAAVGAEWFTGALPRAFPSGGWVHWSAQGPLAAIIGMESPLQSGRSVVVINATADSALRQAILPLIDSGKVRDIRGDLTLMRADAVQAFRVGPVYYVGELRWWRWIWFQLHNHPVMLVLVGLLLGGFLALAVYEALRRMAARRLSTRS